MSNLLSNANPELLADRGPLCNIEAEQAVLGALLVNNNAMLHVGQLRAEHFYEPLHISLFCVMYHEWNAGRLFTPLTIKGEFGLKLLSNMAVSAAVIKNIKPYAELIFDLYRRRQMRKTFDDAKELLWDLGHHGTETIAMDVSVKLQQAIADADTHMFHDDFEVTESIIADMKRDVRPFSTGYNKLDDAMGGGLYPGKSYGFAARKKVGKTILAGSIAQNLNEKGVRHLFICGEMSPAEVQKNAGKASACEIERVA